MRYTALWICPHVTIAGLNHFHSYSIEHTRPKEILKAKRDSEEIPQQISFSLWGGGHKVNYRDLSKLAYFKYQRDGDQNLLFCSHICRTSGLQPLRSQMIFVVIQIGHLTWPANVLNQEVIPSPQGMVEEIIERKMSKSCRKLVR